RANSGVEAKDGRSDAYAAHRHAGRHRSRSEVSVQRGCWLHYRSRIGRKRRHLHVASDLVTTSNTLRFQWQLTQFHRKRLATARSRSGWFKWLVLPTLKQIWTKPFLVYAKRR